MTRRSLFGLLAAPTALILLPAIGAVPVPAPSLPWWQVPVEIEWFGRLTGYNGIYFPPVKVAERALHEARKRNPSTELYWSRLIGWPLDSPQMAYFRRDVGPDILVGYELQREGMLGVPIQ